MTKCDCNNKPYFPAKVRALVNGFERIISFKPGYICSRPFGDGRSHGKHGTDLIFVLRGEAGAINFTIYTGWSEDSIEWRNGDKRHILAVLPADIGGHGYKPRYSEQHRQEKCCWLDDKPCYYDGSSLQAEDVYKVLVTQGEEAMWEEMQRYYQRWLLGDELEKSSDA